MCVFNSVVLKALLVAAHANKKWRCKANKHLTPVAVLAMHAVTSLLYFHQSMQANRNIHLYQEKALIYKLPCSKASKRTNLLWEIIYRPTRKNQWTFLWRPTEVNSSSRNNFAKLRFLCKVSVTVGSIIPWSHWLENSSCLHIWDWHSSKAYNSKLLTCNK